MNEHTTASAPAGQEQPLAVVTTEQFLSSMNKQLHAQYGFLDEPEEILSQLLSLLRLMSGCADHAGKSFSVNAKDLHWSILLAMDLIKETEKRMEQERAYQRSASEELERHLNTCHLIPTGPDKWVCCENGEVAP